MPPCVAAYQDFSMRSIEKEVMVWLVLFPIILASVIHYLWVQDQCASKTADVEAWPCQLVDTCRETFSCGNLPHCTDPLGAYECSVCCRQRPSRPTASNSSYSVQRCYKQSAFNHTVKIHIGPYELSGNVECGMSYRDRLDYILYWNNCIMLVDAASDRGVFVSGEQFLFRWALMTPVLLFFYVVCAVGTMKDYARTSRQQKDTVLAN